MARTVKIAYGTSALLVTYVLANIGVHHYNDHAAITDQAHSSLVERGRQMAEACTACHYLDQRANFIGPHLVAVLGRSVASVVQYDYSPAMLAHKGTWSAERLSQFLTNPQATVPGTKMAVQGWSPEEVQALVAYFKSKE